MGTRTRNPEQFIPQIIRGAKFDIYTVVNGDKFDIGKGQSMWPVECFAQQTKAATVLDDEPDFDGVEDEAEDAPGAAAAG